MKDKKSVSTKPVKKYVIKALAQLDEEVGGCDESAKTLQNQLNAIQNNKNKWIELKQLYQKAIEIEPRIQLYKGYDHINCFFYIQKKQHLLPDEELEILFQHSFQIMAFRRYYTIEVDGNIVKIFKDTHYQNCVEYKSEYDYSIGKYTYDVTFNSDIMDQLSKTKYYGEISKHILDQMTSNPTAHKVVWHNVPERIQKLLNFS